MNVTAIIVTNNRLHLLQEAVAAVKSQAYPLLEIIVVDNDSTDGTAAWLDSQDGLKVIHQENLGGSGGFFTGIKAAVNTRADFLWVMDDDTICGHDSLKILVEKLNVLDNKAGFIGSKCVWKDGNPHLMNLPAILPSFNRSIPFNLYDNKGLLLIETCSFVSLLINVKAVKEVGLPYKEFFIWGDDQEYTRRITKAGYLGLYCINSVVLHKTPINYFPDFYRDTPANIWKHSYGFRNEFFMVKRNKGFFYFICWLFVKLIYTSVNIIRIRKSNRLQFIGVIFRSGWQAILFDPQIQNA